MNRRPDSTLPFLVGVDSDGTVFDTMEIKHRRVFQPLAVKIWRLGEWGPEFCAIAEEINLYSKHRGVNRFRGLAMAFERLVERGGSLRTLIGNDRVFREFVESGAPPSAAALQEFNAVKADPFVDRVLEWSRRSDELYEELTRREGSIPYPSARRCLERLAEDAAVMVVSSSTRPTLLREWGDAGLLPLVSRVWGQEAGDKATQLRGGLEAVPSAARSRCLMIGDALGDLEAARANGALFFPILPGAEEASWERFELEAMDHFFGGTYVGDYQRERLEDFAASLRAGAPHLAVS